MDVDDDDICAMEHSHQNDLNDVSDGNSQPLDQQRVKFSSTEGDATAILEDERKGEREKKPGLKNTGAHQ